MERARGEMMQNCTHHTHTYKYTKCKYTCACVDGYVKCVCEREIRRKRKKEERKTDRKTERKRQKEEEEEGGEGGMHMRCMRACVRVIMCSHRSLVSRSGPWAQRHPCRSWSRPQVASGDRRKLCQRHKSDLSFGAVAPPAGETVTQEQPPH